MAFCMNCGAPCKEGAGFCMNCGKPLTIMGPTKQPQQTVPPQRSVSPQPNTQSGISRQVTQEMPVQPTIQPVQPTVQSQPVYQGQTAPAAKNTKPKSNGLCSAGFVFSLLGVFLFGITSLFGLLFSVFGLISAGKKKQDGKGKAIAGIIMSVLMLAVMLLIFVFLRDPLMDKYEQLTGRAFPTRKVTVEYDDLMTNSGWVVAEDETCIRFNEKDHTFRNYIRYLETSDYYMTGHYEMTDGRKAVEYLQKKIGDACLSEDEIEDILGSDNRCREDNLLALSCDYEAFVCQGESQDDFETVTRHFYGFYVLINKWDRVYNAIEMHNLETGASFVLIREDQYIDYSVEHETDPNESAEPDESDN